MALNVAMADALESIASDLEKALQKGEALGVAVAKLLTRVIKEHKRIVFNGNNYSAEWEKEAKKRGLLNLRNTVDALPEMVTKPVIALLERFKVLTGREMHARYEVFLEHYNKTVNVEGQLMVLMANRFMMPAALEYQTRIGQSVAAVRAGGASSGQGKKLLATYTKLVDRFKVQADALTTVLEHGGSSPESHAKYMRDKVIPAMEQLRALGDAIEVLTPHDIWPLPTYREMLFVK
jgi:glutamine synthetase